MGMKTGFPRPKVEVKGKLYPQPYTAEDDAVAVIHLMRIRQCNKLFLCGVCGLPVRDTKCCVAVFEKEDSNDIRDIQAGDTGLSHVKCGKITAAYCPVVGTKYKLFVISTKRFRMKFTGKDIPWNDFKNGNERLLKL